MLDWIGLDGPGTSRLLKAIGIGISKTANLRVDADGYFHACDEDEEGAYSI